MIIPYIYLLFSPENLTINTMSPNWSSLSFLLPVCLRIFFKLHIKGSQGVDCLLKGRSSFPTITVRVTWKFWFCGRRMDDISFLFFCLKLACQLLVNVSLREGELAKELAFIGKIYMREKEAFPKLKSETTVIDYNFDLKLRATETLIWISHVSSLTFICIHNYNFTTHRWQNQLSS